MGGSPNHIATFQHTMELRVGLEPTTCALQVRCAANCANGAKMPEDKQFWQKFGGETIKSLLVGTTRFELATV